MYNDLTEDEMEFWNAIGKHYPLLFCRGYSVEKINKKIKELGININGRNSQRG